MELRQIRYFLAVADARSFVAAAEKLYISRQAISKSVGQLEEELNVELFMRDSGGAFLTPAGVMFYERVRPIVMELDAVHKQMRSYGDRYRQRIRIAFSVGTLQLLEARLSAYRENQRNADILYEEVPEAECRHQLLAHEADIAVTTEEIRDPVLHTQVLVSSPFGILIREQAELQDVTAKDLAWIPLAGQTDAQTREFCEKNGLKLAYRGVDTRRLLELTTLGKCAMVMPRCLVPEWIPGLRWLPVGDTALWRLYASYPRNIEKNYLFSSAVEDLLGQIFSGTSEKEA